MSDTLKVVTLLGSLRKGSFNGMVARTLPGIAPAGMEISALPSIGDIPLYDADIQQEDGFPQSVQDIAQQIREADGVVIVTPEYNYSVPGGLKNAIDWGSRPYGQSVWGGKPAGVAGASPGAIGTALSQAQLRNVLSAVGVKALPLPEVFFHFAGEPFDAQGQVVDARTRQFLQGFVDRFVQWAADKRA